MLQNSGYICFTSGKRVWRRSTEGKSLGVQRSLCVLFPCEMPVAILEKFPEHIFRLELLRKLTGGRGKQTLLTGFGEGFPWISKIVILPRSKFTSNYEWVNQSLNKFFLILLMLQKSGVHQLSLVVYPIIYDGFYPQVVIAGFFLNNDFFCHQQYLGGSSSCHWGQARFIYLKRSAVAVARSVARFAQAKMGRVDGTDLNSTLWCWNFSRWVSFMSIDGIFLDVSKQKINTRHWNGYMSA